jgi:hypothetical protein
MGRYLDLVSQSFLQKQGGTIGGAHGPGEIGSVKENNNIGEKFETTVTTTPIAWPGKAFRPFLIAIDGATACPSCGQAGRIPHHLSLIFWTFWSHTRLAALLDAMRPDERLSWLAKGLVRVEGTGGQCRELREMGGQWNEVPKAAETNPGE